MPRFVLLRHECPPDYEKPSHWDFMLETDGVLRTWSLPQLPTAWAEAFEHIPKSRHATHRRRAAPITTVSALPLLDHRLAYLDYEGPLTENRGSVSRCDVGTYQLLEEHPGALSLRLSGALLLATVRLTQREQAWSLELISEGA